MEILADVRPAMLITSSAPEILTAGCDLITACLTPVSLVREACQLQLNRFAEAAVRRRETECQEAAANVFTRLSQLRECTGEVKK